MSACHKRGRKRPANVRGSSKGGNAWEMRIEEAARREALQPNTPRGQHDIKTLQRRQRRFNRAFHGQRRKSEWYCRECWKSNWLRITHCRGLNNIAIWYEPGLACFLLFLLFRIETI